MVVQEFHDPNDPEGFPYSLVKGNLANLSALRGTDAETRATFLEGRNTNSVALEARSPASLLEAPIPIRLRVGSNGATPDFGDDEEENENSENGDSTTNEKDDSQREDRTDDARTTAIYSEQDNVHGEIFVTNTQVLFVAEEEADSDMAIGGACIILHAMTEDPEPAIYLQIQSEAENSLLELTLVPINNSSSEEDCQNLFEALCKLISLHPIEDDDDDDDGNNGFVFSGGMIGGGFGDDNYLDYGEVGLAEPQQQLSDQPISREAMLERLDNLLVVPPGLEIKDDGDDVGQFDDADEL